MKIRMGWIKHLLTFLLFVYVWASTATSALSFGIVYYGEPGCNAMIPQGGSGNIFINIYNSSDDVYVLIPEAEISVTTPTGENTPSDWWEFEVTPPVENHQIWIGYEWRYFQANFFLKGTDFLAEEPKQPYSDNYDSWVRFSENRYALAKRVTVTVTASENVPVGEYQLHISISGRESTTAPGGLEVVTAYEAKPRFYVTGPPPSTLSPSVSSSAFSLPVWVAILAILIVACLIGVLAYAIKRGKI